MNSSLVAISILVKSNISRQCLINFFTEVSNQSLRSYLRLLIYMMVIVIKRRLI